MTTSALTPTAEDHALAAADAGQLRHKPTPATRGVDALVPGDRFAARGRIHTVTGFPDIYPGAGMVVVPVDGHPVTEVEFTTARTVVAWKGTVLNYGRTRCTGCGCRVGADHTPNSDDCAEARREREESQSDD